MLPVADLELKRRLAFDNPWWVEVGSIDRDVAEMPPRAFFDEFYALVTDQSVHRAIVLMGPRRVGKTWMIYHAIDKLLQSGVARGDIIYVPLDAPIYTGISLEAFIRLTLRADRDQAGYIFFDEIQYLKNWEIHLKSLVDSFRKLRFVVSGSAAAALRLKSTESGAGRFTDFVLPPLMFHEYLKIVGGSDVARMALRSDATEDEIERLNDHFVDYINFGGYPEAARSDRIRANPGRYIRSDIIDKVLLRDLPSLYGIDDTLALNSMFTRLAYNSGNEVSIESISQDSGLAKNTVRKFLEYLEAAFLIVRISRIDDNARHFKRVTTFKVYLTNPSLRAALFEPLSADSEAMGALVETAIFGQYLRARNARNLRYARWDRQAGEVDLVFLSEGRQTPSFAMEIKWSNRAFHASNELRGLLHFCRTLSVGSSSQPEGMVTTRTRHGRRTVDGVSLRFVPAAVFCWSAGIATTAEIWQTPDRGLISLDDFLAM